MELSWSTFFLEIINFLVLVWILKRFLYKPVLDIIEQRRANIEKKLSDAETTRVHAEELHDKYEHRLADWEEELQKTRDKMHKEIEQEREKLMTALRASLDAEIEKSRVIEQRKLDTAISKSEKIALDNAARFAATLLSRLADAQLESRILNVLLEDLEQLTAEQIEQFRTHWDKPSDHINITSAFPLDKSRRQDIERVLTKLMGNSVSFKYKEDNLLIAGLHIVAGSRVIKANIRDELKDFVDFEHGSETF